jgi:hypothetical protein
MQVQGGIFYRSATVAFTFFVSACLCLPLVLSIQVRSTEYRVTTSQSLSDRWMYYVYAHAVPISSCDELEYTSGSGRETCKVACTPASSG